MVWGDNSTKINDIKTIYNAPDSAADAMMQSQAQLYSYIKTTPGTQIAYDAGYNFSSNASLLLMTGGEEAPANFAFEPKLGALGRDVFSGGVTDVTVSLGNDTIDTSLAINTPAETSVNGIDSAITTTSDVMDASGTRDFVDSATLPSNSDSIQLSVGQEVIGPTLGQQPEMSQIVDASGPTLEGNGTQSIQSSNLADEFSSTNNVAATARTLADESSLSNGDTFRASGNQGMGEPFNPQMGSSQAGGVADASLGGDESSVPQMPPKEQLPAQSPEPVRQDDFNYHQRELDEEIKQQRIAASGSGGFTKIDPEVPISPIENTPVSADMTAQRSGRSILWTGKSIFNTFPVRTTLQFPGAAEQAKFLFEQIPGLSETQARLILDKSFGRNSSAVFGGSRVRGDFTPGGAGVGSDIDVGFGNLNANQAGKVIDSLNKQFSNDSAMLVLERTRITPGNTTPTITDPIVSPEEFFQRSGMRGAPDPKAGQPYIPSGSVTVRPDGTIVIIPPGA